MSHEHLTPNPALRSLDRLVGVWQVFGPDIAGTTRYEWLEGSFFLVQHFDLVHSGRQVKGLEVIGFERGFGAEPGTDIVSRTFDNEGSTFKYVYEVDDVTLTIWGEERGSPAYYRGIWSEGGNVCAGAWVYPGGGYEATMTRLLGER